MGKKPKQCLSDVQIECTPDNGAEKTWEEVEVLIRATEVYGVSWADKFAIVPFVFGMQKLVVTCQINDAQVPSTGPIVEALTKIEGIDGAEMTSIQTAEYDWAKAKAKAAARAAKKAAGGEEQKENGQQQKKKKKKNKKKKSKERVIDEAMIKKQAQKIITAASETDFFVSSVADVDGSGQTNVTFEQLDQIIAIVQEKLPEVAILLTAAGSSTISMVAQVPVSLQAKGTATAWIEGGVSNFENKVDGDESRATWELVCDPEQDQFPIKLRDSLNGQIFASMRTQGLAASSSSDFIFEDPDESD